jgi:cysteinyl-tRNA synthetase
LETFRPLTPGQVRMYVCGITVYDYCHVGHARMLVVFDMVRRHLQAAGYSVTFVRNITDIDDKIIRRAAENGEPMEALTARFIDAYREDCAALNVQLGDHEPRATEYVDEIVAMVQKLVDKGYAYAADNGDVYYAVAKFAPYGRLSGKRLADLRAGARVEVDEAKRDPLDFVLWKAAKPGEPSWPSPWGPGRPGWHIECSAMSVALLGPHFDIHGGGMDLKFPHHENEIAQTCAACSTPFVDLWMHNGFVRIDDEKMSKSLGNFFTIRDVLRQVADPEVLRFFLLGSHYRGPINYTPESLDQADAALSRLYNALRDTQPATAPASAATERFVSAMDDDFNTPVAIAELQSLATRINQAKDKRDTGTANALAAELRMLGGRLGILARDPDGFLQAPRPRAVEPGAATHEVVSELGDSEIERLIDERAAARASRNFVESDRIRDLLLSHGIVLEDRAGSRSTWRRSRQR